MKTCLVLLGLLLVSATLALATKEPEQLQQCRNICEWARHSDQARRQRCLQNCEDQYGNDQQGQNNPYVFQDQHFVTGLQTQHGRLRVLQRFTDRSELLRGIDNYRVAILELEPQAFVVPTHSDADYVLFVARGRGTLTWVWEDNNRESYNLKQGDIMRVRAGATSYIINRDNNERLVLVKLIRPVNTPGKFEAFVAAGGENPESYFSAFSNELLQAFFNTNLDRIQRLFNQQNQGGILKASEQQIRAMSQGQEEGSISWPFGSKGEESQGAFNIYNERPKHSNQYGKLYIVDPSQQKQLQDLDLGVSLINISQGGMTAPVYNSKATKVWVVVEGEGYFEMACPHLSSQGRQQGQGQGQGQSYQKVSSRLRQGTVVVTPAGHPTVIVASNNQNLQMIGFEINGSNNKKVILAGKGNVINQLEKEAKELAFGASEREVNEVFRSQDQEFFFKGPRQQPQGRADE